MIVITKDSSKIPIIDNARYSQVLEQLTGADVLISRTGMPAESEMLIREHLDGWCMLVQVKIAADMASSIMDGRIIDSQCQMKVAGASPQQRWLIPVGVFTENESGDLLINGKKTTDYGLPQLMKYSAFETATSAWMLRGGCVAPGIYNTAQLVKWITRREKWLLDHEGELTIDAIGKIAKVNDNDPFQTVRPSSKGLDVLAYLIGEESAKTLLGACQGDVAMAFCHLSNPEDWPHVYKVCKGLGPSHSTKFCDRMGIGDRVLDLRNRTNGTKEDEY